MLAIIFAVLFIHVFFDYYCQSREMATGKSSSVKLLLEHCTIIFCGYMLLAFPLGLLINPIFLTYPFIIAATHGIQDWYLWRLYKKRAIKKDWTYKNIDGVMTPVFEYWNDPEFYLWIGIDSALHLLVALGLFL